MTVEDNSPSIEHNGPAVDEDNSPSIESVPRPQPRPRRRTQSTVVGNVIAAGFLALAVLFALGVVATYFLRDRTATSPGPQTVTITPSAISTPAADSADARFFSSLAAYGITDNGSEAQRQRYMEFAHHACFALMPPRPQTLDSTVTDILAAENRDVTSGTPSSPQFTREDAQHLTQAAIGAYCPNLPKP
ncbi:DUF732 domain-containing protein [Mycobacterium sp. Marseille-P9652]|uniref:DUF732 domain-containing protein n=1 Tax=Mycobacterium sp. Marseille-P9652 TaxID=2654950 RepID=UPI0018D0F17D|nr:DUF732 domain-containing protein [Mycobacterium sp. Marseille-P9652]